MNTIGYFEIQSSDPKREINFYTAVFGWKFTKEENLPIEYYRIETENIHGGLLKRPDDTPPVNQGTNAYVCSIEVPDYDETHQIILKNGGEIAMPKFAVPGRCWQGYYIDRDANTFGIFQVDEMAK